MDTRIFGEFRTNSNECLEIKDKPAFCAIWTAYLWIFAHRKGKFWIRIFLNFGRVRRTCYYIEITNYGHSFTSNCILFLSYSIIIRHQLLELNKLVSSTEVQLINHIIWNTHTHNEPLSSSSHCRIMIVHVVMNVCFILLILHNNWIWYVAKSNRFPKVELKCLKE